MSGCIMRVVMNGRARGNPRLRRRLRSLWMLELLNSVLLPGVLMLSSWRLDQPLGPFSVSSAALVSWILWQGTAYWWLKLRALRHRTGIDGGALRWFGTLRPVNWALIGLVPLYLAVSGLGSSAVKSPLDLIAGVGLYTLAVLEQVNYYHYQLMYDYPPDWSYLVERKRLKRSSLAPELGRLRADAGRC